MVARATLVGFVASFPFYALIVAMGAPGLLAYFLATAVGLAVATLAAYVIYVRARRRLEATLRPAGVNSTEELARKLGVPPPGL